MGDTDRENIVRVQAPSRHHWMVRAPNGEYLTLDEAGRTALTQQAEDETMWQLRDARLHNVATEHMLPAEQLPDGRYRVPGHDDTFELLSGPPELPSLYLALMRRQGWVCIPSLLPAALLEQVTDFVTVATRPADAARNPPMVACPALATIAVEPVSLWVVRQYLRTDDVRLAHPPSLAVLERDDGRCDVQGWHTDFPYLWGSPASVGGNRVPAGDQGKLVLGVQRNVCVSDFVAEHGATAFKLGSHRDNAPPPEQWGRDDVYSQPGYRTRHGLPYHGPEADIVEAPAGSVILYDARTWHRAGINRRNEPRVALLHAMTPGFVMPFKDTSAALRKLESSAHYCALSPLEQAELRDLLQHRIVGPLGAHAITTAS